MDELYDAPSGNPDYRGNLHDHGYYLLIKNKIKIKGDTWTVRRYTGTPEHYNSNAKAVIYFT